MNYLPSSIEMPSVWKGKRTDRHRGRRVLPSNCGYFVHVTSRAVHQRFLFKSREKQAYSERLDKWSDFSGISVLTHCVLDNHFHLLLWVPPVQQVHYEELIRRIRRVWPEEKVAKWVEAYRIGTKREKQEMKGCLESRMHSLPAFMRVLKQSFSVWFNEQHKVCGTLWEGRYRSMVIHDSARALVNVSTYIDLNPVRARICDQPSEYLWSGYGKAMEGDALCRKGITQLVQYVQLRTAVKFSKNPPAQEKEQDISWAIHARIYQTWLKARIDSSPG